MFNGAYLKKHYRKTIVFSLLMLLAFGQSVSSSFLTSVNFPTINKKTVMIFGCIAGAIFVTGMLYQYLRKNKPIDNPSDNHLIDTPVGNDPIIKAFLKAQVKNDTFNNQGENLLNGNTDVQVEVISVVQKEEVDNKGNQQGNDGKNIIDLQSQKESFIDKNNCSDEGGDTEFGSCDEDTDAQSSLEELVEMDQKSLLGVLRLLLPSQEGACIKLIENNDIEFKVDESAILLHWLCEDGYAKVVSVLLAKMERSRDVVEALINHKDGFDNTPLYYAVKNKRIDIVKILIAYGADVNGIDDSACSWLGSSKEDKKIVDFLRCAEGVEQKQSLPMLLSEHKEKEAIEEIKAILGKKHSEENKYRDRVYLLFYDIIHTFSALYY